jgi:hypothetical protein
MRSPERRSCVDRARLTLSLVVRRADYAQHLLGFNPAGAADYAQNHRFGPVAADHAWTPDESGDDHVDYRRSCVDNGPFVHTLQVGPREHEIPLAMSVPEAARPTNQATAADSRPTGKSGESGAVRIQKVLWGPHQLAVSAVLSAIRSVGDHAYVDDVLAVRFRHRSLGVDAVSMSTEMTRSVDGGKDRHRTVRDSEPS